MQDGSLHDFCISEDTLKGYSPKLPPGQQSTVRRRSSLRESLHNSLASIRQAATGTTSGPRHSTSRRRTKNKEVIDQHLGGSMSSLPMGDSKHLPEIGDQGTKDSKSFRKRTSISWMRVSSINQNRQQHQQEKLQSLLHPSQDHDHKMRHFSYQNTCSQPAKSTTATLSNTTT